MVEEVAQAPRRGRVSRYPNLVTYHESPEIHAQLQAASEKLGLSFAEVQRIVNRAGIQSLQLADA